MVDHLPLLDAILRRDLASFTAKVFETLCPGERFLENWHIEYLAWRLAPAASGKRMRLIVNLPPRSLKSIAASVALPAWLLGHNPSCRIITVSYADDLARKHARDTRIIMESGWYRRVFPATRVNRRKNTETELTTTCHGFRLATSISGGVTGRGANLIIIDDPIKPAEAESELERKRVNEWYDTTLYSRLDDKEAGAIILMMQRLHQDDLTGHLIEKGEFEVLSLPAIATDDETLSISDGVTHHRPVGEALHPARESLDTLQRIKSSIGSRIFEAQYQQSPVPAEGNLFKATWLERYPSLPPRETFRDVVQSWDTATKIGETNDYSVCTTWGIYHNTYYLLDVLRDRWEFPDLLRTATAHAANHRVNTVLIEDANSGSALAQSLRLQGGLNVLQIKVLADKRTRAVQQSAVFEAGRVRLPEKASWLEEFEKELLAFPNGRYDDQVDSAVQFLQWAAQQAPYIPIVTPYVVLGEPPKDWDASQYWN
jgi:predicted phage terminase large subunit-like protein